MAVGRPRYIGYILWGADRVDRIDDAVKAAPTSKFPARETRSDTTPLAVRA